MHSLLWTRWPSCDKLSTQNHRSTEEKYEVVLENCSLHLTMTAFQCQYLARLSGFPRLLESHRIVFVKFPGPGKSWNLLGNDADADAKICASTHLCSLFEQFLCCFFAACDSDEHILQYGCRYHTIYVVSNCSLSLYVNIAGL